MIELQCANCGKTFWRRKQGIRKHRYCSRPCYWEGRKKHIDPKERDKRYYQAHKEAIKRRTAEYAEAHREQVRATKKRYDSESEHRDKHNECSRRWARKHPEKVREYAIAHRDKANERNRRWAKAHPEKVRANCQRFRARRRKCLATLEASQIPTILAGGCFFCGSKDDLAIAHDVAAKKGGNLTRANVFCLCRSCNAKMHTLSLADMLEQKVLLP